MNYYDELVNDIEELNEINHTLKSKISALESINDELRSQIINLRNQHQTYSKGSEVLETYLNHQNKLSANIKTNRKFKISKRLNYVSRRIQKQIQVRNSALDQYRNNKAIYNHYEYLNELLNDEIELLLAYQPETTETEYSWDTESTIVTEFVLKFDDSTTPETELTNRKVHFELNTDDVMGNLIREFRTKLK
ncbi:unnamed protein product [Candida verbasci]|uniref:Uncharacterized protein n=1 Tax=Candida verbasci TaxID=1227364 RepID=A0A9W4TUD1_9ASCO|nr:unnamed protein product [Candida verbasci]